MHLFTDPDGSKGGGGVSGASGDSVLFPEVADVLAEFDVSAFLSPHPFLLTDSLAHSETTFRLPSSSLYSACSYICRTTFLLF